jgi:small-conductance mechanosensitive channel
MVELADFSVVLRVRWWIKPPLRSDALDTRGRILTAIREHLTNHGVDLPFPTQQILFHDQTEETDGDRRRQREGWPAGEDRVPAPDRIATALVESRQAWRQSGGND